MDRQPLVIGGARRDSGAAEPVRNPWDGSPVAEACLGNPQDLDDAIAAAARAFAATRRLPTHRRVAILESVAERIEATADELVALMAREGGKPVRFCRGEVARAATTFRLGAAAARQAEGEVLPVDLHEKAEGRLCLHRRVPRGPVAAIAPFNFPLNLVAHKLAPAIAVGSPVVLKPPAQCPLTAYRLAEMVLDAGWPAEALSVIHCQAEVAQRMVEDPRMKVLSFTGSDGVGWKLKSLAGKKQVLLELGGNAPCVVDAGVDLEAALPGIVTGAWAHAGQVCIKAQRLLIHSSLYDDFLEGFVAATEDLVCGDPLDDDTVVGPLIDPDQVGRVLEWVRAAVEAGARLHCGGQADGPLVLPTVLTEVPGDARVRRDEVFGPVTMVDRFDDFGEALQACNDTRYGLQAGVFTPRVDHALRAFEELDYGGVLINDVPTFRVDNFPYGGTKDSGFGREGVAFAMQELTEPKVLILRGLG